MNFIEAMKAMLDGKKVTSPENFCDFEYIYMTKDGLILDENDDPINIYADWMSWTNWQIAKQPRSWTLFYHAGMNAFSTQDPGDTAEVWEKITVKEVL